MRVHAGRSLVFTAFLASGCTTGNGPPADPRPGSAGEVSASPDYPTENIGTSVGSVINDFAFEGYVDPVAARDLVELRMGDFYNPTGDGVFGEDAPFAPGAAKPTVLMVNVSAVWCSPCKEEAQKVFPGKWAELGPKGMMLLMVLADSQENGVPADLEDLDKWTIAFQARYPSVLDPTYQMGALFDTSQYPANFIVDATTMQIIDFVGGKPPESFWQRIEQMLE